jgi:SLOG-like protein
MKNSFDQDALKISEEISQGPHVAIIGSANFQHEHSEETCAHIGRMLAEIPDMVLITGGCEGAADTVGRAFDQACRNAGRESQVFHILPKGSADRGYGKTIHAGSNLEERREILGRVSSLYIVVEGSSGTVHETDVASSCDSTMLPIGGLGGHASVLYSWIERPAMVDKPTWLTIGSETATPEEMATAIRNAVEACQMQPA